jgi:hypothetical protein
MRIARGLFRIWLVLSVLWVGAVGIVAWPWLPPEYNPSAKFAPPFGPDAYLSSPPAGQEKSFDPDQYLRSEPSKPYEVVTEPPKTAPRWEATQKAAMEAFIPPTFVLVLGSALGWALRGFRDQG